MLSSSMWTAPTRTTASFPKGTCAPSGLRGKPATGCCSAPAGPCRCCPRASSRAGFDGLVASAGAYVEVAGTVLVDRRFPADLAARTVRALDAHDAVYILEAQESLHVPPAAAERLRHILDAHFRQAPEGPVGSSAILDAVRATAERACCAVRQGLRVRFPRRHGAPRRRKSARAIAVVANSVADEGRHAGELYQRGISKADGVAAVIAHLGIAREDTVAIGDGANDLEMVAFAGVGVAIEGSHPGLLAIADRLAAPPREEGPGGRLRRARPLPAGTLNRTDGRPFDRNTVNAARSSSACAISLRTNSGSGTADRGRAHLPHPGRGAHGRTMTRPGAGAVRGWPLRPPPSGPCGVHPARPGPATAGWSVAPHGCDPLPGTACRAARPPGGGRSALRSCRRARWLRPWQQRVRRRPAPSGSAGAAGSASDVAATGSADSDGAAGSTARSRRPGFRRLRQRTAEGRFDLSQKRGFRIVVLFRVSGGPEQPQVPLPDTFHDAQRGHPLVGTLHLGAAFQHGHPPLGGVEPGFSADHVQLAPQVRGRGGRPWPVRACRPARSRRAGPVRRGLPPPAWPGARRPARPVCRLCRSLPAAGRRGEGSVPPLWVLQRP